MKTKQCFCQSIYNGETKQVENCACGKCSLAINPVPTQMTSNEEKIEEERKEFNCIFTPHVGAFKEDPKQETVIFDPAQLQEKIWKWHLQALHSQKERVVEMCEEMKKQFEDKNYMKDFKGYHFIDALSDLKTKIEEGL